MVRGGCRLVLGGVVFAIACGSSKPRPVEPTSGAPPAAADSAGLCDERAPGPLSPLIVDEAQRYAPDVERFSEVRSALEAPIETCRAMGQAQYLRRLRCDDGSAPFETVGDAARARVGNVGAGGRCDNVIDLYRVECPERSYDIYMDLYMCLRSEIREQPTHTAIRDRGVTVTVPKSWGYFPGQTPGVAFVLRGPDAAIAGRTDARSGRWTPTDIAPLFEALELQAPAQLDRVELGDGIEGALVEVGERRAAVLTQRDTGRRNAVVLLADAAALEQYAEVAVGVLVGMWPNDHRYVDYADVMVGDATDIRIGVDEVDGKTIVVPHGWKVIVQGDTIRALLTDARGTRLSFERTSFSADDGADARALCEQVTTRILHVGTSTTIVYADWDEEGTGYRRIIDSGGRRFVAIVRKNPDGNYTAFTMTGAVEAMNEESGIAITEGVAAADAAFHEAD